MAGVGFYIYYKSPISPLPLVYALALAIGSITYLIWKKKQGVKQSILKLDLHNQHIDDRLYTISSIGYYLTVSLAYISLLLAPVSSRPVIFFVLVSIAALLIACNIFTNPSKTYCILLKTLILGFLIHSSVYLFFSGVGTDYWFHLWMNEQLFTYGDIQVLNGKEPDFPIMHIAVCNTMLLSGLTAKIATILSVSIPTLFSSVFVYLTAKNLFDKRTALFAVLLFTISNEVISWAIAPQTTSYGLILITISVYLLSKIYKYTKSVPKIYACLLIFFMGTLILTHAVSSFIMLAILCGFVLSHIIYQIIKQKEVPGLKLKSTVAVAFLIGLVTYWTVAAYDAHNYGVSFFYKIASMLADTLSGEHEIVFSAVSTFPDAAYMIHRFFNEFGLLLLISLFVISMCVITSHKSQNISHLSIITMTVILISISVIFPLIGSDNLISERWGASTAIFLSVCAAYALSLLSATIKTKKTIAAVLTIILIICFFQVTSSQINGDSPMIYEPYEVSPNIYSVSEKNTLEILTDMSDETIITDVRYSYLIDGAGIGKLDYYVPDWTPQLTDILSEDPYYNYTPNSIVVWREIMYSRPLGVRSDSGTNIKLLGREFYNIIDVNYDKIYETSDTSAYYV